jgi:hypothetical protein
MARGPLAHLKPHLAEREPSEGGLEVGRDPRSVPETDWQRAGLPLRTLAEAARAKCLDCCGGQLREVRFCLALTCPLWPFRMGTDPFRGTRGRGPENGRLRPIPDPGGDVSAHGPDATSSG